MISDLEELEELRTSLRSCIRAMTSEFEPSVRVQVKLNDSRWVLVIWTYSDEGP